MFSLMGKQDHHIHVLKGNRERSVPLGRKQTLHRIETTADKEVAMVFSSSNLILCPPVSTETQVKKNPPLS